MKAYSVNEIKKQLEETGEKQLVGHLIRLAKYKAENKELLTYLLYHASDEAAFIDLVKEEAAEDFSNVNRSNLYFAKKTIRKVLRKINKYSRYSGKPETELELRIFFCSWMKNSGLDFRQSKVLENLFEGQMKKIDTVYNKLHEDLQYDFRNAIEELRLHP